jgi:hypothetical protein
VTFANPDFLPNEPNEGSMDDRLLLPVEEALD